MKVRSLPAAGTLAAACVGMAATVTYAGGLQPQGSEYQLTRGVPGDQVRPRISLDVRGGWLLWQDAAIDGDGLGIAAVRLGAGGGGLQGTPIPVNQATAGDQENPAIVTLPDGGAVAFWQGGRQGFQKIYARRISASGAASGPDILVSTGNGEHQIDPSAALLDDGSIVVAWASYRQDGSFAYDVYGRRIGADGTLVTPEFRLNATSGMNRRSPAVAAASGGGFLATWVGERQAPASSAPNRSGVRLAAGSAPTFEVRLTARPFGPDGAPLGAENSVSSPEGIAAHPTLASLPDGRALVAWTRRDTVDSSRRLDIYSRLLDLTGAPVGEETLVNSTVYGDQYSPNLAVSRHGALVVWTSMGQDGSWEGVFGRWLDSTGTPRGDEIPINSQIGGGQLLPAVATGPDSNLVVAWSSNLPRVGYEIFAQRLMPLLLRAESAGAGRLRLSWPTVGGGVYQLQTSRDGQTWVNVGGSRTASAESDAAEVAASGQVVLYRVLRAR